MGLELVLRQQQRLEQKLELKLEQRLEQRQVLVQELKLLIPDDFLNHITFEDDEDIELLEESFPFLMLHELNHPLQSKGKLYIPDLKICKETDDAIKNSKYFGDTYHNAVELGIDRGAIIVGVENCGYALNDILSSHAAISERALRDMLGKDSSSYGFIARLDAGLREHSSMVKGRELKARLNRNIDRIEKDISCMNPDSQKVYDSIVKSYREIYRGTKLEEGNNGGGIVFKDFRASRH